VPRRLLAVLAVAWAVVWVQRAALSPAGPFVQQELGLDYGALGLLSTLGVVAGALGYLAAGVWATRRARATLLAGAALLALATLASARAGDYAQLALAQALAGAGEGLFYVPALAMVTRAFEGARQGRALGILDMGISAGSFVVLVAAGPLVPALGWRGLFLGAAVLGLLLLALLLAGVPRAPPEPPARLREVLHRRAVPVYAAVVLMLIVYFALLYLAPAMLVARGFDPESAALLAALAVGLGIPWHWAGGVLADRFGAARSGLAFGLVFALALLGLALAQGPVATAVALVAAYGIGIAAFLGIIALVPRVLGHHLAAPAFGVFWGLGYLGGSAGPVLLGALADRAGFGAALLAGAGLAALGALALLPLARSPRVLA
jgi:predicted MFS family arabinose efflux permease